MSGFVLPPALAPIARALTLLVAVVGLALTGVAVAAPASASPATMVSDGFSRSLAAGWGTAELGGNWSVNHRSRFAVDDGVGTVALTSNGRTQYAAVGGNGTTNYAAAQLAVSRVPTGSGLYVSVAGRRVAGAGQYLARTRWLPDGSVALSVLRRDTRGRNTVVVPEAVVTGVNGGVGQQVRIRVQVTGTAPTTIRAKVWQASAGEPSGWTQTGTDGTAAMQTAGGVAFGAYLSRRSQSLTLRVDDVDGSLSSVPAAPAAPADPTPTGTDTPAAGGTGTSDPATGDPATGGTDGTGGTAAGDPSAGRDGSAGSAAVGSTQYAAPAGALYVSPSGNDAAGGTQSAPYRTLAKAVAAAPAGATIVLRQGSYNESVTIPRGKKLTVQSYPGEAVWLDGSQVMTGWAADGSAWRVGWTADFDHSPTYTAGAADSTQPGWSFVNAAYPMAAHPEEVFVDGVAQKQVASRGAVTPGTFYVDGSGNQLYLGSNPAGHEVRASTLRIGLTVSGAGSVVRGIGIQRYATPVPDKGALRSLAADVTIENVVVRDNATQGIYVGGNGLGVRNTLRHVTAERNGLLGVESSYSDGLVVDGLRAVGNNAEHFNSAPVSGGMKISRARGITVRNGVFADNLGPGLWFDESVYDATITGNDLLDNTGHGLSFEISSKALIADNLVSGNGDSGLKLNDASNLEVWNNTIVGNAGRPIWLVQDSRQASNLSTAGHDPRQQLPDPTVTWLLGPATVKNNVIGGATTANCLLCVQDSALHRTAAQIAVTADGNVYVRTGATSPRYTVTWPVGSANPQTYATVGAFRSGTGQEAHGAELVGDPGVDGSYALTPAVAALQATTAQALPAAVASRMGAAAGTARIGTVTG